MDSWTAFEAELDAWAAADRCADFWWRDDDAVDATPSLDSILHHVDRAPLALAVIPALAVPALAERLAGLDGVAILQHGWRHDNHLSGGRSEYPASRADHDVARELLQGRRRLLALFGECALPVFAPPWHGLDERLMPILRLSGMTAVSRRDPRPSVHNAAGLKLVNAHVAPIAWSDPPGFDGDDIYLSQFVEHLRGRRDGTFDAAEPTGLLTHHLDQNDRSLDFVARLVHVVATHPGARWCHPRTVFA